MTALPIPQRRTGAKHITIIIIVAIIAAVVMTAHAQRSHIGQYNAPSIWQTYKQGSCNPVMCYLCRDGNLLLICGIKPNQDLYAGVWLCPVGCDNLVITGYVARWDYWQKKILGGCSVKTKLP